MTKQTMKQILDTIYENGRITSNSTQEELENEFEFEAIEQGWTDEEIKEAINSDWFPILAN